MEITEEMVNFAAKAYCEAIKSNGPHEHQLQGIRAALQSIAQPVKVPDEIYIALDESRVDLNYLFGRVAVDGSFAQTAADSLRKKLDKVAKFIYAINDKDNDCVVPSMDRPVKIPEKKEPNGDVYIHGWNSCVEAFLEANPWYKS